MKGRCLTMGNVVVCVWRSRACCPRNTEATLFCTFLENRKCPHRTNFQILEFSFLQHKHSFNPSFIHSTTLPSAYRVLNNMPGTEEVPNGSKLRRSKTKMLLAWWRSSKTSGNVTWRFCLVDMLLLTNHLFLQPSPECVWQFWSLNAFTDGRWKA